MEEMYRELREWRESALRAVRGGLPPVCKGESIAIPDDVRDEINEALARDLTSVPLDERQLWVQTVFEVANRKAGPSYRLAAARVAVARGQGQWITVHGHHIFIMHRADAPAHAVQAARSSGTPHVGMSQSSWRRYYLNRGYANHVISEAHRLIHEAHQGDDHDRIVHEIRKRSELGNLLIDQARLETRLYHEWLEGLRERYHEKLSAVRERWKMGDHTVDGHEYDTLAEAEASVRKKYLEDAHALYERAKKEAVVQRFSTDPKDGGTRRSYQELQERGYHVFAGVGHHAGPRHLTMINFSQIFDRPSEEKR